MIITSMVLAVIISTISLMIIVIIIIIIIVVLVVMVILVITIMIIIVRKKYDNSNDIDNIHNNDINHGSIVTNNKDNEK